MTIEDKKRENMLPSFFYIFIEIMYMLEAVGVTYENVVYKILLYGSVVIAGTALLNSKWYISQIPKLIIIIVITVMVYYSSGESKYFILILSMILIHVSSYESALKAMFGTRLVMVIGIILSSLIGIIPNEMHIVSKGLQGFVIGYSLGFPHPNILAQMILSLFILWVMIRRENINKRDLTVMLFLAIVTFMITKSRTGLFLMLLVVVLCSIPLKYLVKLICNRLSIVYILILSGLSIYLPSVYDKLSGWIRNVVYLLNGQFNGRIANATMAFHAYPITLFGKILDLEQLEQLYGYNVIDNGYVYIFFDFGVIGSALIIFLYLYSVKKLSYKKSPYFILGILIFLTAATSENIIRTGVSNVTMIFWYEFLNVSEYSVFKRDTKLLTGKYNE